MSAFTQLLPSEDITIQAAPAKVKPIEKLLTGLGLTLAIGLLAATLPANSAPMPIAQPQIQIS